jgi:hypothetical protein
MLPLLDAAPKSIVGSLRSPVTVSRNFFFYTLQDMDFSQFSLPTRITPLKLELHSEENLEESEQFTSMYDEL